jgi:hypothetical protein
VVAEAVAAVAAAAEDEKVVMNDDR